MNTNFKIFKKGILALSIALSFFTVSAAEKVIPVPTKLPFKERPNKTAADTVYNMGFGWNLGNTLDATYDAPSHHAVDGYYGEKFENSGLATETCWGMPKTTKDMIHQLAVSGIRTIRIPISWHGHITDSNYKIDPAWMARVKEIVDWSIDEGLYVIINIHHDNVGAGKVTKKANGYTTTYNDKDLSKKYLTRVWEQICKTFNNDYDEHLIFETMNEPRIVGHSDEWWCPRNWSASCPTCCETFDVINEYNQAILDTIRKSGGNNATKRVVMIPAYVANPYAAIKGMNNGLFKLPKDSVKNKLALSVHMYTPYNFAMNARAGSSAKFTESLKNELQYHFNDLNSTFVSQGIPVVIGEMGATNKGNLEEREIWMDHFVKNARKHGMAIILWDNGSPNNSDPQERFGFFNRKTLGWYFPSLIVKANQAVYETK